tara:strand:+ start:290 stop:451 length:162 start_codon:yes stop_codon:yes gene_type:complete
MIKLVVSLLIQFPKLADLFFKVRDEYFKAYKARRLKRNDELINRWLHDDDQKK